MTTRRSFITLLSGAAASSMPCLVFAKSKFPNRPIRLVIPFPPGGGFDAIGRPWADRVKPLLDTVAIENQGGGAGIDAASVARAGFRPDVDPTPAKSGEYIDYDIAHWGPLIKEIGLKID